MKLAHVSTVYVVLTFVSLSLSLLDHSPADLLQRRVLGLHTLTHNIEGIWLMAAETFALSFYSTDTRSFVRSVGGREREDV